MRVAKYLVQYSEAKKKEAAGSHVIVYTDESYIHSNHAPTMGWIMPGQEPVIERDKRVGRLIMFHAITKDGLLVDQRNVTSDGVLAEVRTTAEYVYAIDTKANDRAVSESAVTATDKVDDKELYHGNIDTDMWMAWLHNRLVPAFTAFYSHRHPPPKMILVMDNASYHNPAHADWKPSSALSKEEAGAVLIANGITAFSYKRKDGTKHLFTQQQYQLLPSRGGPYASELQQRVRALHRRRPELVLTRTRRIFAERGWDLVFTPPLAPELQPIERV